MAKKWSQKFKQEYTVEWPCITKSQKGIYHAFCTVCSRDISVEHGGRDDVRRHIATSKHAEIAKSRSSSRTVASFFTQQGNEEDHITRAEIYFTGFLVEHNIPIAASDHAGPLFKKMFPDSKIASKYGCARTKTSAIIDELASNTSSSIADKVITQPFSLATDGSNDGGEAQLYPVLLTYFNNTSGVVEQGLLSLPACQEDSTGENIFKLLDKELNDRKIPWDN